MSVISVESVFTSLIQNGPLAVEEHVSIDCPFTKESKAWVKNLRQDNTNVTKYRALRSQIFEFLGINSFSEIDKLIGDPIQQKARNKRACTLLGNMFGMDGTSREVEARVHGYARTADAVVNSLKSKILAPYASHIATTNEIEVANSPVELILIMFNNRYHRKARFEARRKLVLMNLAGSIDQRERETDIEGKFSQFLHFLNDYVWSTNQKIGEHDIVYLQSTHSKEDFSCTDVKVICPAERDEYEIKKGSKQTLLKRRRFTVGTRDVPIYVSIRKSPRRPRYSNFCARMKRTQLWLLMMN